MSERDNELDQLLAPLTQLQPSNLQMRRWQTLVGRTYTRTVWQVAAAACIGFLVGAACFRGRPPTAPADLANNFDAYATIDTVSIKGR
jgi:hypothetical protein